MQTTYERSVTEQSQIQRQIRRNADKLVDCKFCRVAKLLWPFKTAAHLAAIANTSPRTAERWLSGEFKPPYVVQRAINDELYL